MMPKARKILFRVDAGGEIGLGHFYRSLNLATVLHRKGYSVTFVHLESEFWRDIKDFRFSHYGYPSLRINEEMLRICKEEGFNVLFVDGIIEFNKGLFEKLKEKTTVVFYQNNSVSRALADIFFLPSIHQEEEFFEPFLCSTTKIYAGLEYFTFNSNVLGLSPKTVDEGEKVQRIGLVAGGSDPQNCLMKLYSLIDFKKWNKIRFNFYFGMHYLFRSQIPQELPENVAFQEYNPEEIIKNDFLFTAFGVSTYEFLALGMPVVSFGHQKSNTEASRILASKTGAFVHLGLIHELDSTLINDSIDKMVDSTRMRRKLCNRAKSILDFKGIDRVAEIIDEIK